MNTHDIELPPLPTPDADHYDTGTFAPVWKNGKMEVYGKQCYQAGVDADRKRMATVVESAWREGWKACRDSEYVGSEAEDSAYGDSEANRIALGLDQGESCGLEADRKRRGELVGYINPEHIGQWKGSGIFWTKYQNFNKPVYGAPQPAEPVTCFKCGHPTHRGECVNVAPQPAEPVKVPSMRELIADDAYAATFQSVGQYRKALLARYTTTKEQI